MIDSLLHLFVLLFVHFAQFLRNKNSHFVIALGQCDLHQIFANQFEAGSLQFVGRVQVGEVQQIGDSFGGHFGDQFLLAKLFQYDDVVLWGRKDWY